MVSNWFVSNWEMRTKYLIKCDDWEIWSVYTEVPNILVSNQGRVFNTKTGRLIGCESSNGYVRATIKTGLARPIHRMVAEEFIGVRPENMDIDHIDRCKTNNRLNNLRYLTHKENLENRSEPKPQRKVYVEFNADHMVQLDKVRSHELVDWWFDISNNHLIRKMKSGKYKSYEGNDAREFRLVDKSGQAFTAQLGVLASIVNDLLGEPLVNVQVERKTRARNKREGMPKNFVILRKCELRGKTYTLRNHWYDIDADEFLTYTDRFGLYVMKKCGLNLTQITVRDVDGINHTISCRKIVEQNRQS